MQTEAGPVKDRGGATEERLAVMQGGRGDALVQKCEDCEGERFLLLLWLAPIALGGNEVGEEWMKAGGSAGEGEAVSLDGLPERSFQPKGGRLDVSCDGAGAGVLRVVDAMPGFNVPREGADQFDGLGAVRQDYGYVVTGDAAGVEPLYKVTGSRVNSFVISVADTTSLLLGERSGESVQSRSSGGRKAVQLRRLEHCSITEAQVGARLTGRDTQSASSLSFPGM